MPDLSEVLAAEASRQQPAGGPTFEDLLAARAQRRQHRRRVLGTAALGCTAAATAVAVLATGPWGPSPRDSELLGAPAGATSPAAMLTRDYSVTYTGPEPGSEGVALHQGCASLPRVREGAVQLSQPPHYIFQVEGTAAEITRFEQCILALPDTSLELQTPGPSATPTTPAPTPGCTGFIGASRTDAGGGAGSPEQAAEQFAAPGWSPPFPLPITGWQRDGEDAGGVYVRANDVRLHTVQYPNGTWTVDAGSNCK